MAVELNIGLDLGGDTLKIAYAYADGKNICYGKIAKAGAKLQIALPAIAFYQADKKKWIFGDEVDSSGAEDFVNVVKIKNLISLLRRLQREDSPEEKALLAKLVPSARKDKLRAKRKELEEIGARNRGYYLSKHDFPKFHFPEHRKVLDDFEKMVQYHETFVASETTPQQVCEGYFQYVKGIVDEFIVRLKKEKKVEVSDIQISIVHPSKVGEEYVKELSRIVEAVFQKKPKKVLSSTNALSMYARHRGALAKGESFLIFDMGDESISVAKGQLGTDGTPLIDGVDGHNDPIELGGTNVDDALAEYLECDIKTRETMGTPSYGTEGHIYERGLRSKQYLMLKHIKRAKVLLSQPVTENSLFAKGVPISIIREVYIQRMLTRQEFSDCLGISDLTKIGGEIATYIFGELERNNNKDVKKVFIAGGLIESYDLLEHIKAKGKAYPNVQFCTFDDGNTKDDGYSILSHEDSVYASAVGGAIVALCNYETAMVLSLSYGTWFTNPQTGEKYFSEFAKKGTRIQLNSKTNACEMWSANFTGRGEYVLNEEIFSCSLTAEQLDRAKAQKKEYVIGDIGSPQRKKMEKEISLKTVAGGKGSKICYYYNGMQIGFQTKEELGYLQRQDLVNGVSLREGIRVDANGRAKPLVENAMDASNTRKVYIKYLDTAENRKLAVRKGVSIGLVRTPVPAYQIVPAFDGVDDIDSIVND